VSDPSTNFSATLGQGTAFWPTITATDVEDGQLIAQPHASINFGLDSGSVFPAGTTTLSFFVNVRTAVASCSTRTNLIFRRHVVLRTPWEQR